MIMFVVGLFIGAVITVFAISITSVARDEEKEGGEKDEQH